MNDLCSIDRLKSALAGKLSAEDEDALARHMEQCETCGMAMEELAAEPSFHREVETLLWLDPLDESGSVPDTWSLVDFGVEYLEPSDNPNHLGRLGGYDIMQIIGRGGMGIVLKGFDRELKRHVAIKVLAPHLAHSSLARKRFAREAQAAAAVVHPHVLAIHQVQPNGRLPFIVMPLVSGESLADRLAAQGLLELNEVLRIGMQAAAGLAAAHEQGLVHRDIKPANILLEHGVERAVLTDFGLARAADDVSMTRWGMIAGTPQYMSPEQARGENLDCRSDLFSLGCVLYEMATGVSPFRADSTIATLRRLVEERPQPMASLAPELPAWFVQIVERLLEKDSTRRFASANEVSEVLASCLAHIQQPASVPLPASLVPQVTWMDYVFKRNRKGVIAMLGTIVIALLGALLVQSSAPQDIGGNWSSDEWGTVVFEATQPTQYTGHFNGVDHTRAGIIQLKWSRVERRFNGTWQAGADFSGKISLHLVGNELRGAWSSNRKSQELSGTPRMAELVWARSTGKPNPPAVSSEDDRSLLRVNLPQPVEVLQELEKQRGIKTGTISDRYNSHENEIRITLEPVYDRVDAERHYPLVGNARLHRLRYRCTVSLTDTSKIEWPIKESKAGIRETTFYYDRNSLHLRRGDDSTEPKEIDAIREQLRLKSLSMKSGWINDPGNPSTAFAIAEALKFEDKKSEKHEGRLLLVSLKLKDGVWTVADFEFVSQRIADEARIRFLDENPHATVLPPRVDESSSK